MQTAEIAACPGCGGRSFEEFDFAAAQRLRRCRACRVVFAPAYGDPSEIYVDGYLQGDTDFGLDTSNPLFQEFLAHAAHVRFSLLEQVVRPPGRFVDVGCGTGEVLAVARDRGWQVYGAEPVAESARIAGTARGLDVRPTTLEESGLPQRSFDVVGAFHVLEHMTDGQSFLRSISRWARPGGYLVLEVPNWRSLHRIGWSAAWPHLRPLEHVAHYTPATLAAALRRAGLEPVRVHTPGFLWREQTLDQMLNDLGTPRAGKWVRRARVLTRPGEQLGRATTQPNELGWWLLRGIERGYAATRVGVVVLAIARVP